MNSQSHKEKEAQKIVIFLHIPKTGGTTLWHILRREYGSKRTIRLMKGSIERNEAACRNLLEQSPEIYRIIGSHIPYGVHTSTTNPYSYFTYLRDPVQWLFSSYYKILRKKKHPLHDKFTQEKLDILQGIPFLEDNIQTRLLAGITDNGICTREHLEIAKTNLKDNIDVIGLLEHYDESLILLKRFYGWKMPYYYKKNVGTNTKSKDKHSEEMKELARQHNYLDVELYEYAKQLFEIQIQNQDRSFQREVAKFKWLRPFYERWQKKRLQ